VRDWTLDIKVGEAIEVRSRKWATLVFSGSVTAIDSDGCVEMQTQDGTRYVSNKLFERVRRI
jgi:hypothetical protein